MTRFESILRLSQLSNAEGPFQICPNLSESFQLVWNFFDYFDFCSSAIAHDSKKTQNFQEYFWVWHLRASEARITCSKNHVASVKLSFCWSLDSIHFDTLKDGRTWQHSSQIQVSKENKELKQIECVWSILKQNSIFRFVRLVLKALGALHTQSKAIPVPIAEPWSVRQLDASNALINPSIRSLGSEPWSELKWSFENSWIVSCKFQRFFDL